MAITLYGIKNCERLVMEKPQKSLRQPQAY